MRLWKTSRFALALIGAALAGNAGAADIKSVHDLMAEDLEPAAEVIWDSAGWITAAAGEEELWPTTDAGWAGVAGGADRIAEISRVLAAPHYAEGLAQWAEISAQLEIIARTAKRDAERHDKAGLFDSGGHLYQVCVARHERHMIGEPELE